MKIKVRFNRTNINKDVMANEALFFTDEIDRDIVDKIVDYLRPFDNIYDLEKYFNTEVCSNCIIITTTLGLYFLHQILDNIERITNYEPVKLIYAPNKEDKTPWIILHEGEKPIKIKITYFECDNTDGKFQKILFCNDEIPRLNWHKIVNYIYAENDVAIIHYTDKYVHMHTGGHIVTITTTYDRTYVQYLMENIERIANGLEPIGSSAYSNTKSEEKSTMEKNSPFIPRVKFISESKGITVSFGRGEDASYLVFREVVRYGWIKRPGLRNKKKSINTTKNHNITAVTIFVQGYGKIEYYDMVRDAFEEMANMADLDFEFRFSDNINANSGAIVHDLAEAVHDQIEKVDCLCFSLEWKIDDLLVDGHDKDEIAEAAADLHFEVAALQEMYDHVKD